MKINYTLWGTELCGGTRFIYETANILVERGHEVTMTALGPANYSWLIDKRIKFICPETNIYLPTKGYVPINKIINRGFKLLKIPLQVDRAKILEKAIPDCDINISTYHPNSFSVFNSNKGKMFACIQHNEKLLTNDEDELRLVDASYRLPLKSFVVSRWLEDFLKKEYNKDVTYVGSAANKVFRPMNNKEEKTVCAIVRGFAWKGDEDLLDAFEIIHKQLPDVKFKVAGHKKLTYKLMKKKNYTFELDHVGYLHDDDLVSFYSSGTVFVWASHFEGLGVPPLEAMKSGTACVISDCLGIRDFSKNNYNSFVVPIKNPEALAKATIRLLTDKKLREKFEKNSIETAKAWTWERVVDRMLKLFKKELKN